MERTRDYLAANAAESGADVLLKELADTIERQARELAEAKQKLTYTEESAADTAMRAHKWMVAHNNLMAGKPYEYPEPADLPNAIARAETAEAEIARLTTPLEGAKVSAEELEEMLNLAEVAVCEPGRNGNYGYAHDPADESRNQEHRLEARIKVADAVPHLIDSLHHATAQVRLAREEEREACAKVAESHTLGEEIVRLMMSAERNHVKLWSAVSRAIAAAIRKETDNG